MLVSQGKDVFVADTSGAELEVKDTAKFVLPLLSAVVAFLTFVVCLIVIFHICLCANLYKVRLAVVFVSIPQWNNSLMKSRRKLVDCMLLKV